MREGRSEGGKDGKTGSFSLQNLRGFLWECWLCGAGEEREVWRYTPLSKAEDREPSLNEQTGPSVRTDRVKKLREKKTERDKGSVTCV